MSFVRRVVKNAAVGVGVAETPEALAAFLQPGCAAAIWRRNPLPDFQTWLDTLEPATLPKTRVVLRPCAVRGILDQCFEASGTPGCDHRNRLGDDVAALADIFAGLMGAEWLRLRLDVIDTNACRKFHVDAVTARLVCTYRGLGTQYGISTDGSDPRRVFTVPTGSPVLLRGTRWPERPKTGLLHRSPPIEGTGKTRLLLVLDPVTDPAQEADHMLH